MWMTTFKQKVLYCSKTQKKTTELKLFLTCHCMQLFHSIPERHCINRLRLPFCTWPTYLRIESERWQSDADCLAAMVPAVDRIPLSFCWQSIRIWSLPYSVWDVWVLANLSHLPGWLRLRPCVDSTNEKHNPFNMCGNKFGDCYFVLYSEKGHNWFWNIYLLGEEYTYWL